ncbi:glycosyltransferase family 39 protein [Pigmentibacter sp. JX0631]|uniref:glycosyltransferase family 39 protein n=1 Tax=Pigmentibacter sp. JX0631 TaxID=2976982 RepID=UPI00246973FB|nr:glycosyltransferase family 39 protein [Pigmentibacter sp. JX0631]WGL60808.1 glycosyltransferase family 39 protein [Pigmentibacter sp. JX0631]
MNLLLYLSLTNEKYKDVIVLRKIDIIVILGILFFLILFSYNELFDFSLTGDQIYHAYFSKFYSIEITKNILYHLSKFDIYSQLNIDSLFFKWPLFFVNIGLIMFFYVLFIIHNKLLKKTWHIYVFFNCIFIFLYLFSFRYFGGYSFTEFHPPLRTLLPSFFSSISLVNNYQFFLPQILCLLLLGFTVFKIIRNNFSFFLSFLSSLCVVTIPVLWYSSTILEFSIWSGCAWSLSLLFIYKYSSSLTIENIIRIVSIISIFTLIRHTAILAVIPIFILIIIKRREYNYTYKNLLIFLLPILSAIPYIIRLLYSSSPASYSPGECFFIPLHYNVLERIILSFRTEIPYLSISNAIGIGGVVIALFSFIPTARKNILNHLLALMLFILGYCLFYSINCTLWGGGRYQAEYVAPFFVLGFVYIVSLIYKYFHKYTAFVLIFIICYNLYNIYQIKFVKINLGDSIKNNLPIYKNGVISQFPVNYDLVFKELKANGLAGNEFVIDPSYIVFSVIINDYTIKQYLSSRLIYDQVLYCKPSQDLIHCIQNNSNIKVLVIHPNSTSLIPELIKNGWKEWKIINNIYSLPLVLMKRF